MATKKVNRRIFMKSLGISATGLALAGSSSALYYAGNENCLKVKAVKNTLKMGHCAPAVMSTNLDTGRIPLKSRDLIVAQTSGMPGGIGNSGNECGGVTSSLMYLSLLYKDHLINNHYDKLFEKGTLYLESFNKKHCSVNCRDILKDGDMKACLSAIYTSPEMMKNILNQKKPSDYSHHATTAEKFRKAKFHCCHAVFDRLKGSLPNNPDIYTASWPFIGGTLFKGYTCGALIAGIHAIGLSVNKIEDSYMRTFNMIKMMMNNDEKANGNTINKFNISINKGKELVNRFQRRFGAISCQTLTRSDFARKKDVDVFLRKKMMNCQSMCDIVAENVMALT